MPHQMVKMMEITMRSVFVLRSFSSLAAVRQSVAAEFNSFLLDDVMTARFPDVCNPLAMVLLIQTAVLLLLSFGECRRIVGNCC